MLGLGRSSDVRIEPQRPQLLRKPIGAPPFVIGPLVLLPTYFYFFKYDPRLASDLSLRAGPRQRPPRKYVSHDTRFPITPGHKSTLLSSLGIHVNP